MADSYTPQGTPVSAGKQRSEQQSPTRQKRSHGVMQTEALQRSQLLSPNATPHANSEHSSSDNYDEGPPSTYAHSMLPPKAPEAFRYQEDEQSGASPPVHDEDEVMQQSQRHQRSATPTPRPSSPRLPTESDTVADDEQSLPDEPMSPFDWEDLEDRYHAMIDGKQKEETQIWEDFQKLCEVCRHQLTLHCTQNLVVLPRLGQHHQ